ncbi:MAG TPA: ABC transporter permease [Xanthomonadaceae bacterium]|nr:ABC transporter permease [Xanthomonadaceae bacterium]
MKGLLADLRHALRLLARSPGFALIAIAMLALGIGANTAIFSVVRTALLSPLPYEQAARMAIVWETNKGFGDMSIAYPNYLDWVARQDSMQALAVYRRAGANLTGLGEPEQLRMTMVSANLFEVFGRPPQIGRGFAQTEDRLGAEPVVVLGHDFWQRRFNGDASVLGSQIELDGVQHTIVGVAPEDLRHPTRTDVMVAIGRHADSPGWESRGNHPGIYGFGLLKPGVSLEAAQQEIDAIARDLEREYPDSNTNNGVKYTALEEFVVGDMRGALLLLSGAVGLVLLVVCVNMANLLLARAYGRHRELAVRSALGAGRWRVARQLLAESLLLATAGGALGVVVAHFGVRALELLYGSQLPRIDQIGVDSGMLLTALALTLFTGVAAGLVPALVTARQGLAEGLRGGSRGGLSAGRRRVQSTLAVTQTALAIMLLVGAGLLVRSFGQVLEVDPGIRPANVLTAGLRLPDARYPDEDARRAFWQRLLPALEALPQVQVAGITNNLPFVGGNQTSFRVHGAPPLPEGVDPPFAEYGFVTPGYFEALGMTLMRGRLIEAQDRAGRPEVMVVDEAFAREHWPEGDAIGQQVLRGGRHDESEGPESPITVVGVVRTVRHNGLDVEPPRPQMYFPADHDPLSNATLVLRTVGDPANASEAVTRTVQDVDPLLPLTSVQPFTAIIDDSLSGRRLSLSLLGVFAVVAAVLAVLGIYAVMSYGVSRRAQEMGVRIAVGAGTGSIVNLVLREVARLTAIGLVIGFIGAALLGRYIESQLFGVGAYDPLTFLGVAMLILLAALAAGALPARRATRVDPLVALREE